MLFSCVLSSPIRSTCSKIVILQRVFATSQLFFRRQNPICACHNVSALQPSAHRLRLKAQPCLYQLTDMQAANTSYGKQTTAVASDEDKDEEGGGKGVVGKERGSKEKGLKKEVDAVSMEVLQNKTDTGACKVSPPAESGEKTKRRREKRKWMKKKLRSADTSNNLMSELPFSLTSPTTWKELGFPSPQSTQKKRKRGHSGGRVDSEEDAEKIKKKKESQRPNYFISIPITNKQISAAVMEVQEAVLQGEPRLAKAMIPVPTLHITLLVTHLANQEQVDLAASVLAQAEPSLAELLGGRDLVLPFSGISHFRKEVVFVGLAPGQHRHTLDAVAELLRSRFVEQGLLQGDGRGFEPHLTIMKLSRVSKLRSQGIKRVDPALYSNYTNKFFGDQTVERVDLCSMLKKKQHDGYYHTETSLQLDLVQHPLHAKRTSGRRRSEPDEAELLRVSRRLVEDAVNRALQQYKQETLQNGGGPNATAVQPSGNTEETATKTDTTANSTTDNRK
uniref:A-kinase anchor protein 7-like isoform X2 n=1 Tax=Semicossyphus pulcher TaxID=241346 RepID=UPI0037E93032